MTYETGKESDHHFPYKLIIADKYLKREHFKFQTNPLRIQQSTHHILLKSEILSIQTE